MTDNIQVHILDPETAQFSKGPGGVLQLEIKGKKFYPRVWIYRSYPLSNELAFLSVRDASREDLPEIGLIRDIKQFSDAMRNLITLELERRYFVPVITEVIFIKEARDYLYWKVITDKGKRQFTVCNPYENIRSFEDNKLFITDIHNCKYEIQDFRSLKNKMKDILARYIYL